MDIIDEDIPQGRMLTEEEDREMKENLAQRNFGMNLAEFTRAWLASLMMTVSATEMSSSWRRCS